MKSASLLVCAFEFEARRNRTRERKKERERESNADRHTRRNIDAKNRDDVTNTIQNMSIWLLCGLLQQIYRLEAFLAGVIPPGEEGAFDSGGDDFAPCRVVPMEVGGFFFVRQGWQSADVFLDCLKPSWSDLFLHFTMLLPPQWWIPCTLGTETLHVPSLRGPDTPHCPALEEYCTKEMHGLALGEFGTGGA